MKKCRMCGDEAVAVFHFSRGCVCFPHDQEQALCLQHIIKAEPLGDMVFKQALKPADWEWFVGRSSR
jgi:hypothetical protein